MICDNKNENKKVFEWIEDYTKSGEIDAVTGYFTVGALAYLSETINERISKFRIIVDNIIDNDKKIARPLDLLNENITIDAAFQLKKTALEAVEFLKQEKVLLKTLEPNFCHAKAFIYKDKEKPTSYYVTGSSNMTETGLGLKKTSTIELNTAGTGIDSDFTELKKWFSSLWDQREARFKKTVNGEKVNFKEYLIAQIKRIFIEYTPRDLYYKTLFEMFGRELIDFQNDPALSRNIGRLEHSEIYKCLYEFQQKGVFSLIKMLESYNGAILADAVGLGKTWSALAVMKYYQSQGYDIILLCPKKLEHNWQKFLKKHDSRFEKDQFDYVIRFHTDLQDNRMENYSDGLKMEFFQRERPKLLVIDESHNLRNNKSNRYKFLVENILRPNKDIKVLMLSATPINNSLNDVRNQFNLLVCDRDDGFRKSLGINSINGTFRRATQEFRKWVEGDDRSINSLITQLPSAFFKLTDALIVARTRTLILGHTDNLIFPEKSSPRNIFVEGSIVGNYKSLTDFLDAFPPFFSGYRPAFYIEQAKDVNVLQNEQQRDMFLVKMMTILMLKRLESSWWSFQSTVKKIYDHHINALSKVKRYQAGDKKTDMFQQSFADLMTDEDDEWNLEELTLGKREIPISEIDSAGALNKFKDHLQKDTKSLKCLLESLALFEKNIEAESQRSQKNSRDEKLNKLMLLIKEKQASGFNRGNQKILIFTAFTDTAHYIFNQLSSRGFKRMAVVTGSGTRIWNDEHIHKKFEPILERFAPYTKLFVEKEWAKYNASDDTDTPFGKFADWQEWVRDNDERTRQKLDHPIDILIATDCLSEGQNLQDCDFVVNYDIHWNPVRAIQRMGRIDRLGSVNDIIYAVNFWPTDQINSYLNLQKRVEDRMATMRLVGSEVHDDFTDDLKDMLEDEMILQTQEAKLIKEMQTTWDDIETGEQAFGFDNLSLENFRQDLQTELTKDEEYYLNMPHGIYTGFVADKSILQASGLIALLGYPSKKSGAEVGAYHNYELIYIDASGNELLLNQTEVLAALSEHKDCKRQVSEKLDQGDSDAIKVCSSSLKFWLDKQADRAQGKDNTSSVKSSEKNLLEMLVSSQRGAFKDSTSGNVFKERYSANKYDLVLWFTVE